MTSDTRTNQPLLEICIATVADAVAAEQGGADRVELCANLVEGGTTPSQGMTETVLDRCQLPVMVMIRPRGGHFCFDDSEVETMIREAHALLKLPIAGIVIGALTPSGQLDEPTCRELIAAAGDRSVTFHRAFDQHADARRAIDQLIELGVDRILTSGQAPSVPEGVANLRRYVEWAGDGLAIMPGGGVRPGNAAQIVGATGVAEIHCSASQTIDTPVAFWRDLVPMMSPETTGDLCRKATQQDLVSQIRNAINGSRPD